MRFANTICSKRRSLNDIFDLPERDPGLEHGKSKKDFSPAFDRHCFALLGASRTCAICIGVRVAKLWGMILAAHAILANTWMRSPTRSSKGPAQKV